MSDKSVNQTQQKLLTVNNENVILNPVNRKTHTTRKTRSLTPLLRSPSPAASLNESLLRMETVASTGDLTRPKSATSK